MENTSLTDVSLEAQVFRGLKGTALILLVSWTVAANVLVFVVLYKNPRLQTVPNLLVGNLAFSDICLGTIVLPLSTAYAIMEQWVFGRYLCEIWLSADILCCTASIWNMSTIGLDRYWAITSPVTYINKRNKRTAFLMIGSVWVLAAVISLAPLFGWKANAPTGNHVFDNVTNDWHCTFLDLPAYTIYSATGSFFLPSSVMFFVYYKIYRAFAEHRARQIYRQRVIRRHIESTILHEISHVLPTSDEFAKSDDDDDDDSDDDDDDDEDDEDDRDHNANDAIIEEDEDKCLGDVQDGGFGADGEKEGPTLQKQSSKKTRNKQKKEASSKKQYQRRGTRSIGGIVITHNKWQPPSTVKKSQKRKPGAPKAGERQPLTGARIRTPTQVRRAGGRGKALTFERVQRHKNRKEKRALMRKSLQKKPPSISAAKEKRGVKVLGIILGCFTVCWTPFFLMYLLTQFCSPSCKPNVHIEQFITWLGYSNSAMNPIIYTVFNRDYQNALKRLFTRRRR